MCDKFISLSGDYESRMCPSVICISQSKYLNYKSYKFLFFSSNFSAFKEIVESDTFIGRLGESWLEEGLEKKVAGDLRYFLFCVFVAWKCYFVFKLLTQLNPYFQMLKFSPYFVCVIQPRVDQFQKGYELVAMSV